AGPGTESLSAADSVHDLGLVSDEVKASLLEHCQVLVQPSRHESFSRAIMEAWQRSKPVVANSDCLATALAVTKSGGGWTAGSQAEWVDVFTKIDRAPEILLQQLGVKGRDYAEANSQWSSVIDRYEVLFSLVSQPADTNVSVRSPARSIHQL